MVSVMAMAGRIGYGIDVWGCLRGGAIYIYIYIYIYN